MLFESANLTGIPPFLLQLCRLLLMPQGIDWVEAGSPSRRYQPAFNSEKSIEELSLVSTLALKKLLKEDDEDVPVAEEIDVSGFDPYDSS